MQPRVLVVATVLADTMGSGTVPAHLLVLPDSTLRRRSQDFYSRPLTSPMLLAAALPTCTCPRGIAALAQLWTLRLPRQRGATLF